MKKIFLSLLGCLLLVGCSSDDDVIKNFSDSVNGANGYHILGQLEVFNNEDKYIYQVEASYSNDDNFKVSLKNTINNHEQIILRNSEGVYVLTPSLNKSFKFQSEWPYNSSQVYLLQTILNDINTDDEKVVEKVEDGYTVITNVDYSSNSDLIKQKLYFDNDYNLKTIEVLDSDGNIGMKMTFSSIDFNSSYEDSYFALNSNLKDVETSTTSKIESVIYPMFLPENTVLTSQEKISLENGERIILTFDGDNPFTIIQESVSVSNILETVPTDGEPEFITGTLGTITDSSVNWVSNGVEFYVVSDSLNQNDLLTVANSLNTMTVGK